jgi:hypothetical protein
MDISRLYLLLGVILAAFGGVLCLVLQTPSLQWRGMDDEIWPAALVLLAISSIATASYFFPLIRRAVVVSPHKKSFAVGFLFTVLYTGIGVGTIILIPFRMASGV